MLKRATLVKALCLTLIAALSLLGGCAHLMEPPPPPAPMVRALISPSQKALDQTTMPVDSIAVMNFSLMGTRKGEGPQVADIMLAALLEERYAKKVIRIDHFPKDPEDAVQKARATTGAGLVMTGLINELDYGGRTSETRVQMEVEVFEVETGKTVWKLIGAFTVSPEAASDKIFYVDPGASAPMPTVVAEMVVRSLARTMVGASAKPDETDAGMEGEQSAEDAAPPAQHAPRDKGGWSAY